jgi:predicted oxidoreductase
MSHGRSSSRTTFADLDRRELEEATNKLQRILRDLKAFDPKTLKERRDDRLETFQKRVNNLLSDLLGMGSPDYAKHKLKPIDAELDTTFGDHYSMEEYREAAKHGVTPYVIALAWLLAQGPHIVPIPGATKVSSIESSLTAPRVRLDAEDLAALAALGARRRGPSG